MMSFMVFFILLATLLHLHIASAPVERSGGVAQSLLQTAPRRESGDLRKLAGTSQLDYILGTVSFLAEDTVKKWKDECPLPSGACWRAINAPGAEPFFLADYADNTGGSDDLCRYGTQDNFNLLELDEEIWTTHHGHALDIGGGNGHFAFALANAGWNVTSFEPHPENIALMHATLCKNKRLAPNIVFSQVGQDVFEKKFDHCQVLEGNHNAHDKITRCGQEEASSVPADYTVRQAFSVRSLEDILKTVAVPKFNLVKINVEGFECHTPEAEMRVRSWAGDGSDSGPWISRHKRRCAPVTHSKVFQPNKDDFLARRVFSDSPLQFFWNWGQKDCQLPSGGRWCKVTRPEADPFLMAVYDGNDEVSNAVCEFGQWEDLDLLQLGKPGHALDIGGNIGYWTFVLANAGWNVTTFEPISKNVQLQKATLCRNPRLASKITLHQVGLGSEADRCEIIASKVNLGDGITRCGQEVSKPVPRDYELRQAFSISRLDDILTETAVPKVDFVKIDVEGFECQVFKGGSKVLGHYKPRSIHSEVWGKMQGCEPTDYIKMFQTSGYEVAEDEACSREDKEAPAPGQIKNFWFCRDGRNGKNAAETYLDSVTAGDGEAS